MERVRSEPLDFICPVCLEIPEGVIIYQCKNGHLLCEPCSRRVDRCPQCRLHLGGSNISRNQDLEAIIAGMEIEIACTFERQGCKVKMPRKDLADHLERSCEFNPENSISLCKILGFTRCNYYVSRRSQPNAIYSHFVEKHKIESKLRCFNNNTVRPTGQRLGLARCTLTRCLKHMKTGNGKNRKNYRLLDVVIEESSSSSSSTSFKLLVCFITNMQKGNYSVVLLNLGNEEFPGRGITVEISAPALAGVQNARWRWSGKPSHFMEAENAMKSPPLRIEIPHLVDVLRDEEKLECKIGYF